VKIGYFIFLAMLNYGKMKFTAAVCKRSQEYILAQTQVRSIVLP